ncbi:hypothetical protein JTE90_007990 [Oedothorax gibbosus]|uniref:Uncharacterized protein n=1 Tax=Oedothorax gibbosus TaxID=931172 RepID=A0AAV6UX51_9ARAC|nr:hypothetical protein JTE90_007990 [Oedothorax gibbosus]
MSNVSPLLRCLFKAIHPIIEMGVNPTFPPEEENARVQQGKTRVKKIDLPPQSQLENRVTQRQYRTVVSVLRY